MIIRLVSNEMKIYVKDERGCLVMKQIGIRKPIASIPKKKRIDDDDDDDSHI